MVTVAVRLVNGTPSTTSTTAIPSLIPFGATVRVKGGIGIVPPDRLVSLIAQGYIKSTAIKFVRPLNIPRADLH